MPRPPVRTVPVLVFASALACEGPPAAPAEPLTSAALAVQAAAPRLVAAPASGEVAAIVREAAAGVDGRLVVYVGASWCEPCRAFHDALAAGQLDAALAGWTFLEFDIDADKERLAEAGYRSRYVPLFALPAADGRASGRQVQGGIKGAGAVEHILARLRPLLAAPAP